MKLFWALSLFFFGMLPIDFAYGHWYGVPIVMTSEADNLILVEGIITDQMAIELIEKTQGWIPKRVRISSGGGDAKAALQIGKLIQSWGAVLEVKGMCADSCAEFLFPLAISKRVLPMGIVAFRIFAPIDLPNLINDRDAASAANQLRVSARLRHHVNKFANVRKTRPEGDCRNDHTVYMAPTPSDWKALGLNGIQEFWYPILNSDFRAIRPLYFPKDDAIGFFSLKELAKMCSVGLPAKETLEVR
jgi:hypothetical protein